jgi:hypothetical protein
LHCSTFFHAVYKTFLTHRCLQGSATGDQLSDQSCKTPQHRHRNP